jgi:NAD+ kinase
LYTLSNLIKMKVAIYGYYLSVTESILNEILSFLQAHNVEFVFEKKLYDNLSNGILLAQNAATFSSNKDLDKSFDLLISIGGDGTILRAATFVRDSGIPILGINAGRLGFLATVQKENIEKYLTLVLAKEYTTSSRTILNLNLSPKKPNLKNLNFALNEVTINRKDTTSMISIETYLNGEYLNSYWADGLIISTPTGSTGYSLSCGGPVVTPDAKVLIITPIAPHNLNARPLVIPENTEVRLKVSGREENYLVSLDSRINTVSNDTILTIKKAPFKINMIEFKDESFLKTIRNKLLWGEDKRN